MFILQKENVVCHFILYFLIILYAGPLKLTLISPKASCETFLKVSKSHMNFI